MSTHPLRNALALAALGLLLAAPAAQAEYISSVGDSFTVNWLLPDGATDPNGNTNNTGVDISAEAEFSLQAYNTAEDYLDLAITATNTTEPDDHEVGLYKIGFGTTPDTTGVTFHDDPDGEFIDASLGSHPAFPDSAYIDVTSSTDPGAPKNLQAGESDTFGLQLSFVELPQSGVELAPFDAFFQSNPNSFQVPSNGNGQEVPAPGSLALLGLGILALGWMGRRQALSGG